MHCNCLHSITLSKNNAIQRITTQCRQCTTSFEFLHSWHHLYSMSLLLCQVTQESLHTRKRMGRMGLSHHPQALYGDFPFYVSRLCVHLSFYCFKKMTWLFFHRLTAFIAKELSKARKIIPLEDSYIKQSITYIMSKQTTGGAFKDPNPLYDKGLQV